MTDRLSFRVWAPQASAVDLVLEDGPSGERRSMAAVGRGWWQVAAEAEPGTRYRFSIDGGPPRPDPRSPWQPDGIDGPSATVDHAAFRWSDQHWRGRVLPGAVFYELHIGTFSASGTFDGAIEHLDELVDLGVDIVEVMPVAEFSGDRGWGYDGVDLYAPHHAYGGPVGLKRFVDACHARGLAIVLDVVYNHLGPAGNHLAEFGPYFSDRHPTNWGDGVNLDGPGSDEVRRFVVDNALMWLRDYHVDGLRLDAVHALVDDSATHLLEQMSAEVRVLAAQLGRPLLLIAESDRNDPRYVRSLDAGGLGMDSAWADEWHHALHAVLTGERTGYYEDFGTLDLLAKALTQAWVYDGTWSTHRQRTHGRPPGTLSGDRFVVAVQNHDQVGNRAMGERLAVLTSPGRVRVAAALLLTGPFTPLLFQGEEWATETPFLYFTDHADPELAAAVSRGRPREFARFGWDPAVVPDPQDPATFERSRLDRQEVGRPGHRRTLDWYRALIELRRCHPDLTDPTPGSVEVLVDDSTASLVVRRGRVRVIVNLGSQPVTTTTSADEQLLLASEAEVELVDGQVVTPPDAVVIVGRPAAAGAASDPGAPPVRPR